MNYTKREEGVVIVTPPVPLTDGGVERMLEELASHLRKAEPYALVFDMTKTDTPTATQRKKLGDHMRTHDASIRRFVRALALIAPASTVRGIATAVFWVSPPPIAYRFFDAQAAALDWAREMLKGSTPS